MKQGSTPTGARGARTEAVRRGCLVLALCLLAIPTSAREVVKAVPTVAWAPGGTAISSQHHLATAAGQQILAQGGNAFDAAVAVSSVLSVVEPISSGLGGGGFFLLHEGKSGREVMIDARETAPVSARPQNYLDAAGELDEEKARNGPLSAGIPGLPAGLVELATKYGRLPLGVSLAPAIRIAREGFEVYPRLVKGYAARRAVMERYAGTRKVFLADGDPPELGETLRQPELAHTLELLAAQGFNGFYRGETARRILADVKRYGGDWTARDLSGYTVKERAPIRFRYRNWDIVTVPPPSSGGIALAEMLQVLEAWDLARLDEPHRVHYIVEAMRRAFRDRTVYLGDPDFVKMPIARLTSDDYAAGLRASILPDKATPSTMLPATVPPIDSPHTSHFSIIDADGNLVAATQTVNLTYGSGMVVDGAGFLLNDEMDDFALRPGTPNAFGMLGFDANAVAPGKRMLSSMTPTFMLSPDKVAVIGGKGGTRIITMVLLGMLGIEQGLDPQQIVALPRFHHQYLPDTIIAEPGAFKPGTAAVLGAMGYDITQDDKPWDYFVHIVEWDRHNHVLRAGADPRNPTSSATVLVRQPQPVERVK